MNLSFLKQAGSAISTGVALATTLAPTLGILSQLVPSTAAGVHTVNEDLAAIAGTVIQVEAMGHTLGLAGPDKLKAAVPLVAQILRQSKFMAGKAILDDQTFNRSVMSITNGMVDLLNSVTPEQASR